jgi:hypothetical protein
MTPVGSAHSGNVRGMAGSCEPVVDRGADPAPLNWRIAWAMVARDQ